MVKWRYHHVLPFNLQWQDGTPIDLTPELTLEGVVFAYTDTSSSEVEVSKT